MSEEELIHGGKYDPEAFKEYRPAQNHLTACNERDKNLADRKVQEQHEKQRKEEIQRQQI